MSMISLFITLSYSQINISKDTTEIFSDKRDGHIYKCIKIGTQIWMAENLAYLPSISIPSKGANQSGKHYYVFDYTGSNVSEAKAGINYKKFGVLYNLKASKHACPSGWHLPFDQEWAMLELSLGMNSADANSVGWRHSGNVGKKLKSNIGWSKSDKNSELTDFDALPGGVWDKDGFFVGLEVYTTFWSDGGSTTFNMPYPRTIIYNLDGIYRYYQAYKGDGFSIRCVKN
jgi:uncharacterized protein (TIGR02145 family)